MDSQSRDDDDGERMRARAVLRHAGGLAHFLSCTPKELDEKMYAIEFVVDFGLVVAYAVVPAVAWATAYMSRAALAAFSMDDRFCGTDAARRSSLVLAVNARTARQLNEIVSSPMTLALEVLDRAPHQLRVRTRPPPSAAFDVSSSSKRTTASKSKSTAIATFGGVDFVLPSMDGDIVDTIDIDDRMFAARVTVSVGTLRNILPNDCGLADMVRFVATRRHLFATTYAMNDPTATTSTRHVVLDGASPLVADSSSLVADSLPLVADSLPAPNDDDDVELPPLLDNHMSSSSDARESPNTAALSAASNDDDDKKTFVSESYSIALVQSVWKFGSNAAVRVELAFARDVVLRTRFVQRSALDANADDDDSDARIDTFVAPPADVDGHSERMAELDRTTLRSIRR